ncbi:MAG TPA: response regulator [Gemmatimonadales bacterium]
MIPRRLPAPARRELGGETVLIVDDEPAVRGIARRILESGGCAVLEAAGAEEALAIVDGGARIGAVVTDLAMPQVNGLVLVELLAAERPALPVAVMSGDGSALVSRPGLPFLRKPFAPEELLVLVSALLRRGGAAATVPVPGRPHVPARQRYRSPPR